MQRPRKIHAFLILFLSRTELITHYFSLFCMSYLYIALLKRDFFYKTFGDILPVTYSHFGEVFEVNILCSKESIFPTERPAPYETQKWARQSVCNVKSMSKEATESLVTAQLVFIHDRHDYYSGIKAYSKMKFSIKCTTLCIKINK